MAEDEPITAGKMESMPAVSSIDDFKKRMAAVGIKADGFVIDGSKLGGVPAPEVAPGKLRGFSDEDAAILIDMLKKWPRGKWFTFECWAYVHRLIEESKLNELNLLFFGPHVDGKPEPKREPVKPLAEADWTDEATHDVILKNGPYTVTGCLGASTIDNPVEGGEHRCDICGERAAPIVELRANRSGVVVRACAYPTAERCCVDGLLNYVEKKKINAACELTLGTELPDADGVYRFTEFSKKLPILPPPAGHDPGREPDDGETSVPLKYADEVDEMTAEEAAELGCKTMVDVGGRYYDRVGFSEVGRHVRGFMVDQMVSKVLSLLSSGISLIAKETVRDIASGHKPGGRLSDKQFALLDKAMRKATGQYLDCVMRDGTVTLISAKEM